jgi:hypothetical protein
MRQLVRTVALGLFGAAALALSAFLPWVEDEPATRIPIRELLDGIPTARGGTPYSLALLLIVASGLAVVGVLINSKLLEAIAALVAFAGATLWAVMRAIDRGLGGFLADLESGAWLAAGGIFLVGLSALILPGKRFEGRWDYYTHDVYVHMDEDECASVTIDNLSALQKRVIKNVEAITGLLWAGCVIALSIILAKIFGGQEALIVATLTTTIDGIGCSLIGPVEGLLRNRP